MDRFGRDQTMTKLEIVQPQYIDFAWEDGAKQLGEVCDQVEEITPSQLKMILSRGERTLLRMSDGNETVGWCVVRVDQLPNMRVLHVTGLVAHNGGFERFLEKLDEFRQAFGCSRIRLSCGPAHARLYRMKWKGRVIESIYETFQVNEK